MFNDWWKKILEFLLFLARVPLAILIIAGTASASFILASLLYRASEWIWNHVLSEPW